MGIKEEEGNEGEDILVSKTFLLKFVIFVDLVEVSVFKSKVEEEDG